MTEIQQYQEPTAQVEIHQSVTQSQIRQTALELNDAHTIATAICRSAFVPDHLRGKPEETAVAILYGATVGFDPITAVQQIFAIGGKPALYARAMVAIVLAAGHEVWTEEERPGYVTVAGRRKGSEHVARVTWTSELAKQAGYDKNSKYRSDPRSMLYARASGDVARRIAPDALMGMAYNVEEMQLVPTAEVRQSAPAKSSARDQVAAAIGAPQSSGSDMPPQEANADVAEPESDHITDRQRRKLHATFGELGIKDRGERIAYIVKVIGRDVESSSDLTKAEAISMIDALDAEIQIKASTQALPPAELDDKRDEIVALAETKGASLWDIESAFAEHNAGITFYNGTAEQLATFHQWVSAQPKKAA